MSCLIQNWDAVLRAMYPTANPMTDWAAEDNSGCIVLTLWNPALGPQPTPEQIEDFANGPAYLEYVRSVRKSEIESRHQAALDALYLPHVVQDAGLDIPSAAFKARVVADRKAMGLALNAARTAIDAAALEDIPLISPPYPPIVPANPDAPEFQE